MDHKDSPERSSSEVQAPNQGLPVHPAASLAPHQTLHKLSTDASDNTDIVNGVLQSDVAVHALLTRLKQSIASAREFAVFLKKRSTLEEDHAQGLKKLCKASHESSRRPENRQETYGQNYEEVVRVHDRMADNGIQFALSLHQMHEDLHEMAGNVERGRKLWKQNGLATEKKVLDAEALAEKAKVKYHSLAEDYDRARTGDKAAGRVFGLKGPKSAAQHEEDLQRKVQQADSDYSLKVQSAQQQRQELVKSLRPQTIKSLQEIISECDNGLTFQLQKFAALNERLLLGNGLCVSPLQGQASGPGGRSLREIVSQIDNTRDFRKFVGGFATKANASSEIRYERHPTLGAVPSGPLPLNTKVTPSSQAQTHITPVGSQAAAPASVQHSYASPGANPISNVPLLSQHDGTGTLADKANVFAQSNNNTGVAPNVGPQMPNPPFSQISALGTAQKNASASSLPPLRPVFGLTLENLLKRDGLAIPLVVYQCIQAVDLFGLEVEGIYRLSGSSTHVNKLKTLFDHDSNQIDFRNPEAFFHDVNSVTGLLKQFLRDLPDPLLTQEHYLEFVEAARIDDDIVRRDNIHATINALPDPNYATLRALILHLNRIQEHSSVNRMNAGNLSIIFGPTLMGTGANVADAGWQVKVIDTVLQNTYQIFDDD